MLTCEEKCGGKSRNNIYYTDEGGANPRVKPRGLEDSVGVEHDRIDAGKLLEATKTAADDCCVHVSRMAARLVV